MGRFADMIILNSVILMLFYFFGLVPENTWIGFLKNPSTIWNNLWAAAGIASLAILAGATVAKGLNYFNNELAATTSIILANGSIVVLITTAFSPVYIVCFNALGPVYSGIVIAPLMAYQAFILFEWWRGRDQ